MYYTSYKDNWGISRERCTNGDIEEFIFTSPQDDYGMEPEFHPSPNFGCAWHEANTMKPSSTGRER